MAELILSNIKLVIWDLDDTFWTGTLSEGEIYPINANIRLIKDLTDRGIICAICSKNDKGVVDAKLHDLNLSDYFVFNSIDWTPKGQRVRALIDAMGLRPVNVLFIDDNIVNLSEAKYYSPDINIAGPVVIKKIIEQCDMMPAKDITHKRLKQYKILEEKQKAKANAGDNLSFLYSTNTRVEVHHNCIDEIDRIAELVIRTNQLNFTKLRSTKEELIELLNDSSVDAGFVTVKDNFGDYGIVGFYAIKKNKFIHFLFSCRTIGQGVEQYVYSTLGCPTLDVVGSVVNNVENIDAPKWINQDINTSNDLQKIKHNIKILFKGPCDLSGMINYINTDDVITEFTHVGDTRHNYIEHHNHSVNYLSLPFYDESERRQLLKYIFNDESIFETELYNPDVKMIFLSTILEPALCIYRNKTNGKLFAYGGVTDKPITVPEYWDDYIEGKVFTGDNSFTMEILEEFSKEYEFVGLLSPEQYIENLRLLFSRLHKDTKVCLLLGSEIPFAKPTKSFLKNRHITNKLFNDAIRQFADTEPRAYLIDFTDYVKSQDDYADRITHFSRRVYYEVAVEANRIMEHAIGYSVGNKSKIVILKDLFLNYLRTSLLYRKTK